tara:strand:- start:462 stop:587 length:126 start_codon:yes stop_codon:yes gene_type:complete
MHKQSPKKTGHLTPDLDIQTDFFKIMLKMPPILPLQIKKPV